MEPADKSNPPQGEEPSELRMDMMRSIVTEPLLSKVRQAISDPAKSQEFEVIIALNELFRDGTAAAMEWVKRRATEWNVHWYPVSGYVVATLTATQILELAKEARDLMKVNQRTASVIYRIWEDTDVSTTLTRSLVTVKADAAQRAFQARGEGIVWAVLDSGIQGDHPHFKGISLQFGPYDALKPKSPLEHMDFTPDGAAPPTGKALIDRLGHGTHVAGTIAGYWESNKPDGEMIVGKEQRVEETDDSVTLRESLRVISGVAPKASLISLKVIADVTVKGGVKGNHWGGAKGNQ